MMFSTTKKQHTDNISIVHELPILIMHFKYTILSQTDPSHLKSDIINLLQILKQFSHSKTFQCCFS